MIAVLTDENANAYLDACLIDPLLGAQLRTDMLVYGDKSANAEFWVASDPQGRPTAALSRIDGRICLAGGVNTDLEEVSAFIRAIGSYDKVTAAKGVAAALRVSGEFYSAPIMVYDGGCFRGDYSMVTEALTLDELWRINGACFSGFRAGNRRDEWYVYISRLIRHGFGFAAGIRERGALAATAGVYATGGGYGIIGNVATYPKNRSQGYGLTLVRYISDRLLDMNLTPALFCAEPSLAAYYGRAGFRVVGEWGRISG
jgi:GNAT superfamily N-acetyltransferase